MSSISHAISAVDASHETIRIALKSGAKISNEDEAREARTAKAKVIEHDQLIKSNTDKAFRR